MQDFGKMLIVTGLALAIAGAVLWRTGGPGWFGRLPGDIFVQKGGASFHLPIVTCLLISAVLTLASWLLRR